MRVYPWAVVLLVALAVLAMPAAPAAAADDSVLKITGTTYTKWLWGNMLYDGSVYNFTTVPGEGYGDNGQGSEIELLLQARVSRQVEVRGRIHSRFNQNQWTNFGGFGGRNPALENPPAGDCVGGDCGEWDPRSNQYVKLRGVTVILTPGYDWLNSATIGASDFGMFDPFVVGKVRYIDRDNASGILFQGSSGNRKVYWDATRISLPRLWAGPGYTTGSLAGTDAAYALQLKMVPTSKVEFGAIYLYAHDIETNSEDLNLKNGQDSRTRFMNQVFGGKMTARPSPKVDLSVAAYGSYANSDREILASDPGSPYTSIANNPGAGDLLLSRFGFYNGYSPVPAGRLFGQSYKANLSLNDPFDAGISFQVEGFSISPKYLSIMSARRETDMLLTDGWDGTFAFPGPTNAKYGIFSGFGNQTSIGYGGWDGPMHQVATLNVDNEFTDFDESAAETAIGWQGITVVPQWTAGKWQFSGEVTFLDYTTNWQAWDDPSHSITNPIYPGAELDAGVGHNFRSAYAPFQDRRTMIGVFNAATVIEKGKGIDLFGKFKYIKDEDDRMTDPTFLPYDTGGAVNYYYDDGTNQYTTASIYSAPPALGSSFQWKPFDSLSDDDRDLKYWMASLGLGYQLTNDLYGSVTIEHYDADLVDGNTAFQAYNLQEMAGGKHSKNKFRVKGRYVMGGAEIGCEYQYNFGRYEPDFGTGFETQYATPSIAADHHVAVGSRGFSGRFGGWNSLEEQYFQQHQLKAFMKVQF
ncbi:MAG TPA: hypothetical protein VFT32_09125 [Candidatus Eisenbacteria bacterium]|nr:hypothetical protein [Candidatus Eisenbacteria bacterium]